MSDATRPRPPAPGGEPAIGSADMVAMFDRIAPRYDLVNTLLSAGMDGHWRRRAAARALPRPGSALDLACGQGELTRLLQRRAAGQRVVGADVSEGMLALARLRHPSITFVHADALHLEQAAGEFDAVTMAFGLRNMSDPTGTLREMARVGRRLVVLEFLRPSTSVLGRLHRFHLTQVVTRLGGLISGDREAYRYLRDTVLAYHSAAELAEMAGAAGWRNVGVQPLGAAAVAMLWGQGGGAAR